MSFTVGDGGSSEDCTAPEINVAGTTANSISVSWNYAGANSYSVYYLASGGSSWALAKSGLTNTSYTVTGLVGNTTYSVAVQSICQDGTQKHNIVNATTGDDGQNNCTKPSASVTNTSTNSISLSWSHAVANSFTIYYKPTSSSTWQMKTGITSTYYTLTGLSANTTYNLAVMSICSDGSDPYHMFTATTTGTGGGGLTMSDVTGTYVRTPATNGSRKPLRGGSITIRHSKIQQFH
jgi:chitin-binding protein